MLSLGYTRRLFCGIFAFRHLNGQPPVQLAWDMKHWKATAKNGEWHGYLHYDNTVSTTLKGNIFKGPFHIPGLYMVMSFLDEDGHIGRFADLQSMPQGGCYGV